jgi:hypothetical protein
MIFPGEAVELFTGAVQLKQAFETGDEFLMQQASERVRPWVADFVALRDSKIQSADGRFSFEIRGMKKYSALLNYARLMADVLQNARLVMWFSEKDGRFLPSVYCPDWKTAAFAMAFAGRLRVCPKCSEIFTQRGDNNNYCKPSHRESHRMARSRWRKKQSGKNTRRK